MVTEKVCGKCGRHCVPAQSYCPKCGSPLPPESPCAASEPQYKLFLDKGQEKQVIEFEEAEEAVEAAFPWLIQGWVARIADRTGDVKRTQTFADGRITTEYPTNSLG